MSLKFYNAVTSSTRGLVAIDRSLLSKASPMKSLTTKLSSSAGRNNQGRITVRHKGGGHKRVYRLIDFKRTKYDVVAKVVSIEYDPIRTAFVALVLYEDGSFSYIISPHKMLVGDTVTSSRGRLEVKVGNRMTLSFIPIGTIIHCIELKVGGKSVFARSAGTYAQIVSKDGGNAVIRLCSGEVRMIPLGCFATIGSVSNPDNKNISIGKAGRSRWLGIRPSVRGVAMNPVDHPHGGGEGRTSGGRHPVSPSGKLTKGLKTRSKSKASNKFILKDRRVR